VGAIRLGTSESRATYRAGNRRLLSASMTFASLVFNFREMDAINLKSSTLSSRFVTTQAFTPPRRMPYAFAGATRYRQDIAERNVRVATPMATEPCFQAAIICPERHSSSIAHGVASR
jgi:hypothetical protein